MVAVAVAVIAGYGAYLLYTAIVFGWSGIGIGPNRRSNRHGAARIREWLVQAGLQDVAPGQFAMTIAAMFSCGALMTLLLVGGVWPALVAGAFAGSFPVASYRYRRARRIDAAREAWPRMLEELRLSTGSLGRSVPQALFDVGRRSPVEMRGAFAAAERAWLLSTDFPRTLEVLKARLADPTADAVCETLVVAHEIGGGDLQRQLEDLIEDRIAEIQNRRDARVKLAGVRFARRFVLIVPLGMALAGLSIGTGRRSYQTPGGQVAVVFGLLAVVGCWVWSGRLMRLPDQPRVFAPSAGGAGLDGRRRASR